LGVDALNGFSSLGDILVRNGAPVDLDTFIESDKMGRGIKPHLISLMDKDRRQQGSDRALAVGACHMNTAITILRIPKAPHKTRDGCEAELNAETPQPIKGRQVFVNRRDHGDV